MEIPEDVIEDVRLRLHRISGQLGGVERMLDLGPSVGPFDPRPEAASG